mmetsp:Transcript_42947/g.41306  ORF Transcript_42947/g.41306 Transcript_42947/m.41306 type:complete len:100 (+) Transcript_42947:1154-1453(+)
MGGPVQEPTAKWHQFETTGKTGRYAYTHPNTDYEQPGILFRNVLSEDHRQQTIKNISDDLNPCRIDIKEKMVKHWYKVDPELGTKIAQNVGVNIDQANL